MNCKRIRENYGFLVNGLEYSGAIADRDLVPELINFPQLIIKINWLRKSAKGPGLSTNIKEYIYIYEYIQNKTFTSEI